MGNQIAFGLTIGVTSGIVTSGLVWFLTVFWTTLMVPWYERRVYKGVQIRGSWCLLSETDDDDPWSHGESLDLIQTAHRITGTGTITFDHNAKKSPLSLLVSGEITDRIVTLNLRSPTQDHISYSVLLLEVTGNGNQLKGAVSFYNTEKDTIESCPVTYIRSN